MSEAVRAVDLKPELMQPWHGFYKSLAYCDALVIEFYLVYEDTSIVDFICTSSFSRQRFTLLSSLVLRQ